MEITPAIITDFRGYFNGQFSDAQVWSDDIITDLLCQADSETGGSGWGKFGLDCQNFKRRGMYYFAAAWLTFLYGKNPANGIDHNARLNVQNKSVGDESVAYRVPAMMEVNNDALTYTSYGQAFYRLRKRAGMGARVV
ncbi:DUF4054 domain-containing protein [Neopusillimonas maritima]|uniref:DUF4054 domain-containing protein n=1 Tax=Neopusillimonas maritima TaxID=2026239 RepID=A0A3A1YZN7_9BURK|nr:DUF4054 domain-containing protein [Neopusillimonas maritima]RIY41954.1 hypothetical protein CJP73_00460 [Neopusillimonas maritima]